MNLPVNFLIIGAAKSGTTSLQRHLAALDGVYFSPIKEPNFHARHDLDPERFSATFRANHRDDLASYFAQADDPLPARDIAFVRELEDYARLFAAADPARHVVIGEASTTTIWSPSALSSVREMHPNARILAVLRDPVERMFSHYLMARKYGFTTLPFREAVERDMATPNPSWGRTELFFQLGCYAAQLGAWFKAMPAENLKVIRTEELKQPETWMDLADWLGLTAQASEAWAENAARPENAANAAGLARFESLNRSLTASGLKSKLANALPKSLKARIKKAYYDTGDLPTLSEVDRAWATELYVEDQRRLEVILKRAGSGSSRRPA